MNSISSILGLRAILGLSIGLVTPLMAAIIAENFKGNERSRMNGLTTSANGIGGAVFLLIGGTIASLGWRGVFLTYSYGIILLILVLLYVPKIKPDHGNKTNERSKVVKLPVKVYMLGLASTGVMILYYAIPTNLAIFIVDNGLGDASTVGYVTALSFFGVFLAGISVTRLLSILKKAVVPCILLIFGLSFLLLSQAHSIWLVAISVFMMGSGFGFVYPILLNKMAEAAPIGRMTAAVSLLSAFANLGQFISPLVIHGIQAIFHLNSIRNVFMIIAVHLGGSTVTLLCLSISGKKRVLINRKV
ncbi:MFS family permease [Paenibacillus sp. V4I3]|nr:MFS family permease [Paenibacillus sp. V4I3]